MGMGLITPGGDSAVEDTRRDLAETRTEHILPAVNVPQFGHSSVIETVAG
jgi:hypothetical protein